jgi:hypothetical protein
VLIGRTPYCRGCGVDRGGKHGQMREANPVNIDSWGCRRNLWGFLCSNFSSAAAHLRHLSALTVHCTAASTLLTAHHHARYTGHDRRGCGEQKKDCNDAGDTTHAVSSIRPPQRQLNKTSWVNLDFEKPCEMAILHQLTLSQTDLHMHPTFKDIQAIRQS